MKRLMMIAWVAVAAGLVAAPATPKKHAAPAAPKKHLVAAAYVAPFSEITQTATADGTLFNQPLVPAMAMAAAQQALAKDYGPIDAAQPIYVLAYLDTAKVAALDIESGNAPDVNDIAGCALLYPVVGGEEAFMAANQGAKKDGPTGVIALADTKKPFKYAKFTRDGKFCAFAKNADDAWLAAFDVPKAKDLLKSPKPALTRLYVGARGIDAVASILEKVQKAQEKSLSSTEMDAALSKSLLALQAYQQKNQMKLLRSIGSVKVALGFDDSGLALWGGAKLRKGATPFLPAGTAMPGAALDEIPAGACLAFAQSTLASMQGGSVDEGVELISGLISSVREILKTCDNKDLAKYKQMLDDLLGATLDMYSSFKGMQIGQSDWGAASIAFDAQKRPALLLKGRNSQSPAVCAAPGKFFDRVIEIVERQWPANGVMKKLAEGKYTFDWAKLVDLVVKELEACSKEGKKADPKDVAQAKDAIAKIFGSTVSEFTFKTSEKGGKAKIAAPGVSIAPAPAGQGAQRLFAAVPEASKGALLGSFYMTPYAIARDVVAPVALKFASAEDAQQYKAVITQLPPAAPGGALAGATWMLKDGTMKFALRLTADEIKTYGAIVNVLASADDDDDDDE